MQINNKINSQNVEFAIGGIKYNIFNIYKSFEEAKIAMDNKIRVNEDVNLFRYDNSITLLENYFYPVEIEQRLINCMRLGEEKEVQAILDHILVENLYKKTILPDKLKGLLFELYGTLIKIRNKLKIQINSENIDNQIDELYKNIDRNSGSDTLLKIVEIFCQLSTQLNEAKNKNNEVLKGNIIEFIDSEYTTPNLTISEVADEFSISTGYAAQLIKEYTGETFFTYLERIRMEHAQKLIDNTDLPIYVIAEKCGYQLSATFCRAYKRRYNISPNKTRNKK